MRSIILLISLFGIVFSANWAILVAGSEGYSNYRHQADAFHAYQSLVKKGFPKSNIILMAHDDIAHDLVNPFRGHVYNKPTYKNPGVDVYEGVTIDYRARDVKPDIFLAVLKGNKTHVANKGSGRVLESTSDDNVFIFFSDHGAPGLIAFPNEYLYATDLLNTLNSMQGRYSKLVFYLEACESGSMFVNLPKNTKIYALSAAGTDESSWATYCSPDDVVNGKHLNSCLGDLFSVNWIEDVDSKDTTTETLDEQFQIVKKLTTKSKVLQWGDTSFVGDFIGNYVGNGTKSFLTRVNQRAAASQKSTSVVSTYDIKLNYLTNLYKNNPTTENMKNLAEHIEAIRKTDHLFGAIKNRLDLKSEYDAASINFDCYKQAVAHLEEKCGKVIEYGLKYFSLLVNVCATGAEVGLTQIVSEMC